jgi:hypothetical protein
VSESLQATDFSLATSKLDHLETFHFPHSGLLPPPAPTVFSVCPDHVREMLITGGLASGPLAFYSRIRWPASLTHLYIQDCGYVPANIWLAFISSLGSQLKYVHIGTGMPTDALASLPSILEYLPEIHTLSMSLDHRILPSSESLTRVSSLVDLQLSCREPSTDETWVWLNANVLRKRLPNLRIIRVHRNLGWHVNEDAEFMFEDLHETLQTLAMEDGGAMGVDESTAGIYLF